MPTNIRLTTMPGTIQKSRIGDVLSLDLFGPSLGTQNITIRTPLEVAPAVKLFGAGIKADNPDASFKVVVTVLKGQRKPAGFDVAQRAGAFGDNAFMRTGAENETPLVSHAIRGAA